MAGTVARWQRQHGRHHLPWQASHDPYHIWLSEIMLQQTQVSTVIDYYQRFIERFPDIDALAQADLDDVMPLWAGLGYYARARHLHACARVIVNELGGRFPRSAQKLATLPGIGPSTAAAIAAFAWGQRSPIMDGNVKRLFSRYFGVFGDPGRRATENALWALAHAALDQASPRLDMRAYTQGLMDLGATLCTRHRPACAQCPLQAQCYARRHGLQSDLPQARVRRHAPRRECTMLILEHAGRVLLERQPAPGIWGGLWSLPRFDEVAHAEAALSQWQLRTLTRTRLPMFEHAFSHFTLAIHPEYRQVEGLPAMLAQAQGLAPAIDGPATDSPAIDNPAIDSSAADSPTTDGPTRAPGDEAPRYAWAAVEGLMEMALPAPVRRLLEGDFRPAPDDNGEHSSECRKPRPESAGPYPRN